jgi:hypothetical protein
MNDENGSLDYLENDWDRCPVCDRHECECPPEAPDPTPTTTIPWPKETREADLSGIDYDNLDEAEPMPWAADSEVNNQHKEQKTMQTEPTLAVENRAQAALYEWEMKGQMSDGQWENSTPHGHWRTPNEAQVVVRPEKVGRNFYTERAYNFANRDLFAAVSDRMIRFAKIAIAFPAIEINDLAQYRWDFDTDLTKQTNVYSNDYQKRKDAQIRELLNLVGVATRFEFETEVGSVTYTEKDARRDLNRLTKCFRTQLEVEFVVSAATHKPVANTVAGILGSWANR